MKISNFLLILFLFAACPLSGALATPYPPTQQGTINGLDFTFQYDPANDAYGGSLFEVYRIGYAVNNGYLHFNMQTGMAQEGRGAIHSGDLYINVGGSHLDGYTGEGLDATYSTGNVFGLALTTHENDMNRDFAPAGVSTPSSADNEYDWGRVEQGRLYSDAVFSTGSEEKYEETKEGQRAFGSDGGNDPFGGKNNLPVHIAEYGEDLGFQGDVTWNVLSVNPWNPESDLFDVNAVIALDALGLAEGGAFELWWSMECGNDGIMIAGELPGSPPVSTPDPEPVQPPVYYPLVPPVEAEVQPSGLHPKLPPATPVVRSPVILSTLPPEETWVAEPVPEPTTMVLFGIGLVCLFGMRKKVIPKT